MSRQYSAHGDEGVEIEKEIYRIVSYLPELVADGADNTQPQEQSEEENLAYTSCCNYFHIQITEANNGLSDI